MLVGVMMSDVGMPNGLYLVVVCGHGENGLLAHGHEFFLGDEALVALGIDDVKHRCESERRRYVMSVSKGDDQSEKDSAGSGVLLARRLRKIRSWHRLKVDGRRS